MKRIVVLLLISFVTICLSACSVFQSPKPTKPSAIIDHMYLKSITDYQEYCRFVTDQTCDLPEDFVHSDSLASIGSFDKFTLSVPAPVAVYTIHLKVQESTFSITIYHAQTYDSTEGRQLLNPDSTASDYSALTSTESGYLLRDDLVFHYSNGALNAIDFHANGNTYMLAFSDDTPFPYSECAIINGLISKDSAKFQSAVDELSTILGITSFSDPTVPSK